MRYTVRSVRIMEETLEAWIEQSENTLDNEESRDYPSDERVDTLSGRLDALQGALSSLQEIE